MGFVCVSSLAAGELDTSSKPMVFFMPQSNTVASYIASTTLLGYLYAFSSRGVQRSAQQRRCARVNLKQA